MRRSVAQSATHCAALHLRASSRSCSLAITCLKERQIDTTRSARCLHKEKPGARSRHKRETQHFFLHTYAALFSYISCTLSAPFSPVLSLSLRILASVVAKRHTFPKEQTTRPTDRPRTHAHSLANSLSFSSSFALAPHQEIRKHDICLVF